MLVDVVCFRVESLYKPHGSCALTRQREKQTPTPHACLHVELVDFGEETSDGVVRPAIVQQHQLRPPRGQERRHVLIVELIHQPEVTCGDTVTDRQAGVVCAQLRVG